ncbi:hypothetical protein FPHYL_10538 [Fusarium phyllophilum]|uniref:Uncharacterized protein n=1 Tax=Fusarium phyllophilum TaxID=47803 RepID=A0A8H5IZR0_9HYPO|nr:hypothetical protein FPHYL_10538 [Fusarium phyllophilum]
MERDVAAQWGLDWFLKPNVTVYDLQTYDPSSKNQSRIRRPKTTRLGAPLSCSSLVFAMSMVLRPRDNRHSVAHNAGNDTAFEIAIILAAVYMTDAQRIDFEKWPRDSAIFHMPPLPFNWSGAHLDTV